MYKYIYIYIQLSNTTWYVYRDVYQYNKGLITYYNNIPVIQYISIYYNFFTITRYHTIHTAYIYIYYTVYQYATVHQSGIRNLIIRATRGIMDAYRCKYVPGRLFLCTWPGICWSYCNTHALLGPFGSLDPGQFQHVTNLISFLGCHWSFKGLHTLMASVQSQVSLPMLLCPLKLSMHHWKTGKEEQIQVLRMSMGIHMQQDHDAMQGASNENMPPCMQMWIWKANRQITQCGALVVVQEPTDNW